MAAAAALLLAACGGDDDGGEEAAETSKATTTVPAEPVAPRTTAEAPDTGDDDVLAEQILATAADLPDGWEAGPVEGPSGEPSPLDVCAAGGAAQLQALEDAASARVNRSLEGTTPSGGERQLQATVNLFPDAETAQAYTEQFVADDLAACAAEELRSALTAGNPDLQAEVTAAEAISPADVADQVEGFRVSMDLVAGADAGTVDVLAVFGRQGRAFVAALVIDQAPDAGDAAEPAEAAVAAMAERAAELG